MCMVGAVDYMDCVTGEEDLDNMLGIESKNILNILDFPMESLEGDGIVGDWNPGNSQCLGPIPSDVLIAPPIDIGPPYLLPPPIDGESGVFQIESPVSELELIGPYSSGKNLPNKSDVVIPARTRSKRVKSTRLSQWLLFERTSTSKMTSNARKSKERRKKLSRLSVSMQTMNDSIHVPDHVELQNASKKCTHCEVTKTPQWREGPMGPKTLCNACGVRHRSGRLFPEYRPAASPTYVPSLHSNSHKKVIEMRDQAKHQATKIMEPLVSQQLE